MHRLRHKVFYSEANSSKLHHISLLYFYKVWFVLDFYRSILDLLRFCQFHRFLVHQPYTQPRLVEVVVFFIDLSIRFVQRSCMINPVLPLLVHEWQQVLIVFWHTEVGHHALELIIISRQLWAPSGCNVGTLEVFELIIEQSVGISVPKECVDVKRVVDDLNLFIVWWTASDSCLSFDIMQVWAKTVSVCCHLKLHQSLLFDCSVFVAKKDIWLCLLYCVILHHHVILLRLDPLSLLNLHVHFLPNTFLDKISISVIGRNCASTIRIRLLLFKSIVYIIILIHLSGFLVEFTDHLKWVRLWALLIWERPNFCVLWKECALRLWLWQWLILFDFLVHNKI